VFATQNIASGTIVDICPVLILSHEHNKHVAQSSLYHYSYNWPVAEVDGRTTIHQAIIFGLGSMFNHSSSTQNVVWRRDLLGEVVVYTAIRDIQPGEELCISYGSNLWFKDADAHAGVHETGEDVLDGISLGMEEDGGSGTCSEKSQD
jgi:SET domain-containing protein